MKSGPLSAKGLPFSVPRAMTSTPLSAHQTLDLVRSRRLRPGRYTALSGVVSSGTPVPDTLQWAPYRSAMGRSKATNGLRPEVGRKGVQEPAKVCLLNRLPGQAEADVERLDGPALPGQLGDQDGAVDTTAGQHGVAAAGHRSPR